MTGKTTESGMKVQGPKDFLRDSDGYAIFDTPVDLYVQGEDGLPVIAKITVGEDGKVSIEYRTHEKGGKL